MAEDSAKDRELEASFLALDSKWGILGGKIRSNRRFMSRQVHMPKSKKSQDNLSQGGGQKDGNGIVQIVEIVNQRRRQESEDRRQ